MDTNRTLFNYYNDLAAHGQELVFRLMPSRVREFKKNNDLRMQAIRDKIDKLMDKYFLKVKGEDGEEKYEVSGEGETTKIVFKEGFTQADYDKELTLLMDQPCPIIF